ncbi:MAG: O-antigen ligase family protein [Deltaproteobacteria bacterium]|nr:O-antigen ligase family protein [Deltaproteobacteria bacterium]
MTNAFLRDMSRLYFDHRLFLACAAAFLLPLKLSWALAVIVPICLLEILSGFPAMAELLKTPAMYHVKVFVAWCGWAVCSSIFGIDPFNSLHGALSLAFFSVLIFFTFSVAAQFGPDRILFALLLGQSIAAMHSILNSAYPGLAPKLFVGKVTESGQLAISVVLAIGMLCYLNQKIIRNSGANGSGLLIFSDLWRISKRKALFAFMLLSALLTAFAAYSDRLAGLRAFFALLLITALAMNLINLRSIYKRTAGLDYARVFAISNIILPLCITALLANMKRGPWAGAAAGSLILLCLYSRKLIAPSLVIAVVLFGTLAPVKERLEQSAEHFYIHGGRKAIWDIGAELGSHYPLGIGYENSPVLRDFSTEIPNELRHFHNNFLNIWVETGWIGLFIFTWWLAVVIRQAWKDYGPAHYSVLSRGLACCLISWQIAGLVEYNFGDSEVLLVVFLLLGVLAAIERRGKAATVIRESSVPAFVSAPERAPAASA